MSMNWQPICRYLPVTHKLIKDCRMYDAVDNCNINGQLY